MKKKIKIHFSNDMNAGKNIFKIFDDKQLNLNYKVSSISLLKVLDYLIRKKKEKINKPNIIFEKGSKSKDYYKKLKR